MERMISNDDVKKLAELSRIEVTEEEAKALTSDLDAILEYVGKIQEVTSVEVTKEAGELRNVMREDGEPHARGLYTEELVGAFPKSEQNYLKVKKIIDQG